MNHHSNHYRHDEGMTVARWSEEPEWWFNKMMFYAPVWTSKNKLCRVYHIGLQATIDGHLNEVIEFLRGRDE